MMREQRRGYAVKHSYSFKTKTQITETKRIKYVLCNYAFNFSRSVSMRICIGTDSKITFPALARYQQPGTPRAMDQSDPTYADESRLSTPARR